MFKAEFPAGDAPMHPNTVELHGRVFDGLKGCLHKDLIERQIEVAKDFAPRHVFDKALGRAVESRRCKQFNEHAEAAALAPEITSVADPKARARRLAEIKTSSTLLKVYAARGRRFQAYQARKSELKL
jgi:hypothetical protein